MFLRHFIIALITVSLYLPGIVVSAFCLKNRLITKIPKLINIFDFWDTFSRRVLVTNGCIDSHDLVKSFTLLEGVLTFTH